MTPAHAQKKYMTLGEGGLAAALTALAFLSIVIAAKAYTPEYAFHAYLFAAASVASVFAIVNRYFERSAEPPPLEIDGKPNYNMGPIKLATAALSVLGHRRHDGRDCGSRSSSPFRRSISISPTSPSAGCARCTPPRSSSPSAAMCCSRHPSMSCSAPAARALSAIWRRGSSCSATISSSSLPAPAICSASPNPRNMPSRNGMPICG